MDNITDSFKKLEGKTIKKVEILGVNFVTLEMEDGSLYSVETICVLPSLNLSGIEVIDIR